MTGGSGTLEAISKPDMHELKANGIDQMNTNPWYRRYNGRYSLMDLNDRELCVAVLAAYDDLTNMSRCIEQLVGGPVLLNSDATEREANEGLETLLAMPLGRAIRAIWELARAGLAEDAAIPNLISACFDVLVLFQSPASGPITISELWQDSPLLFAWLSAVGLLWDHGLGGKFAHGRWQIEYQPS